MSSIRNTATSKIAITETVIAPSISAKMPLSLIAVSIVEAKERHCWQMLKHPKQGCLV